MRVAIAADHRGKDVHKQLVDAITQDGHNVVDMPTCQNTDKACDYPDIAYPIAIAVAESQIDRGVLICGTGIGMCIAANKIKGVRAALVHDEIGASISRRHNDANILCLSADMLGQRIINRIVKTWLETDFEGGRHARRVSKINAIEQGADPMTVTDTEAAVD